MSSPDNSELFTLTYEQQTVTIQRSRELTAIEKQQPVFFMTIVASSIQADNRQETTEFIVTQKQLAIANQPQFENRLYLGKITVDGKLMAFPAIRLNNDILSDGIRFELVECKNKYRVTQCDYDDDMFIFIFAFSRHSVAGHCGSRWRCDVDPVSGSDHR